MNLQNAFIQLRDAWFYQKLYSQPSERDWEDSEAMQYREERNKEQKELFDKQTNDIINGMYKPIAPTCSYDMSLFE